jgi:hypothetical protein
VECPYLRHLFLEHRRRAFIEIVVKTDKLSALLRDIAKRSPPRSAACPPEIDLAAYVEGVLTAAEHARVERHLADCRACLALVGLVTRMRDKPVTREISASALAEVAQVGAASQPRVRRWARVQPLAAMAATLVVLVPLLVLLGRPDDETRPGSETQRSVRAATSDDAPLRVLSPVAGATVDGRRLDFRWSAVPGTPYYDVRIVSDDGELIVAERVTGTDWRPPAELALRPGVGYFVHVDAYPVGNKALSSEHSPFRVQD